METTHRDRKVLWLRTALAVSPLVLFAACGDGADGGSTRSSQIATSEILQGAGNQVQLDLSTRD